MIRKYAINRGRGNADGFLFTMLDSKTGKWYDNNNEYLHITRLFFD